MAGKPKRMSQIKQLLRLHDQGFKIKSISRELGISKNTVKNYLNKLSTCKLSIQMLLTIDDQELEAVFHTGNPAYKDTRFDQLKSKLEYYERELKKTGVTKNILWEEYRSQYPQGYSHSQFCFHLSKHLLNKNPKLKLNHQPGEKLFVDFAGKKLSYIDIETGEIIECQVFVASLAYSDYCFCMAVKSQNTEDFIYALQCCLKQLGGVPQMLVPDNLKSAIIKADKYEPAVNQVLEDFANHYNMVVIPARAAHPCDKALVENQVKIIYSRIYARLRHYQFLSLHELNQAIAEKTKAHNQTRMQQKNYCREACFLSDEKPLLKALPVNDFEIKYYRDYKVSKNNHIYLSQDKHYYSVPYQHIGQTAKVMYTRSLVRIYVNNNQVAVHQRDYRQGKYTTQKEHLCSAHQHYLDRSPQYYKNRALHINNHFYQLIVKIFEQNKYPEQLYRTCDGLFSLYRKTDSEIFTKACIKSLTHQNYSYTFLLNMIKNRMFESDEIQLKLFIPEHSNIRGKDYYK